MKTLRIAAAAVLAAVLFYPVLALAQASDTTVQVPLGDWVDVIGKWVAPILGAAVLLLIRKLPAQWGSVLMTLKVDQLLEKAIAFAINRVQGAAHDKPLTLDVGNKVLAEALDYAIRHGAPALIGWMGGADMIREKILARLKLDAQAAA